MISKDTGWIRQASFAIVQILASIMAVTNGLGVRCFE